MASGGFNFGAPAASASGFSFGQSTATAVTKPSTSAGGFSFGQSTTAKPALSAGGFPFGQSTSKPAASADGSFSFGQNVASTIAAKPTATGGFSFDQSTAPAAVMTKPAATTGFSFGQNTASAAAAKPVTSGFSFGQSATVPSAAVKPTALTSVGLSFTPVSETCKPSSTASLSTSLSLVQPLQSITTITTQAAFGFGTANTSSSTEKPNIVASSSGSSLFSNALSTTSTSKTAVSLATTTSTAAVAPVKQMSYKALEDTVEKWLHDLNEQEKSFLNQASQVNMWDKHLIGNGEKITELHNEVERVKAEQQRLDRELDFILSQQEELEGLLEPIEAQFASQQMVQHTQNADLERERTYRLAENIDSQLKRMMQDLRTIIEHINNSNNDPEGTIHQPMVQVAKILNAHMDSLQWVDQNTNQLQRRVEEVNQLMESRKVEHEKAFHVTY